MTVTDPLNCTLPPGRHGLSREFVADNQRTRLIAGFAQSVKAQGYCPTTIADICRAASISRRTFYEHFGGKAEVASAVIAGAIDMPVPLDSGLGMYVVEMLVREEPEGTRQSMTLMRELLARLRDLEEETPIERSALIRRPPSTPGPRPRLSPDFLAESQRKRIVRATAKCVVERRYLEVRVADIVTAAGTARNTFYDRFPNKEAAAKAVIDAASAELGEWINGLGLDTGFGIVAVELASWLHAEGREEMLQQVDSVAGTLNMVEDAIDGGFSL